MNGTTAAVATILFHLPLWLAARYFVRGALAPSTSGAALRDTFLTFCVLWRLETLLLGGVGLLQPVPAFVLHILAFLLLRARCANRNNAETPLMPTEPPARWDACAAGGWVAVVVGLAIFRVMALPDPYDSLTYHLMLPAQWLDTGTLALFPTTFGDIAPTYTPAAVEGFFLALMMPTGADLLARVGQLPFLLAGAHCVASLVRALGAQQHTPRWAPPLAATVFLLFSDQLKQGTGSMVDVATSTFFLAALVALFAWRQQPQRGALLMFGGAMAGMFIASRFQSLIYAPLLLLPVLGPLLEKNRKGLLLFGAPVLLVGAFPFLRNLIIAGNPVYPVQLPLVAATLPGLFTSQATYNSPYNYSLGAFCKYASWAFTQSGLTIAALGVVGPVVGRSRPLFWLPALGVLMVVGHFLLVPYNANYRFLIAPWGLLVAATVAAGGASLIGRWVVVGLAAWFVTQALEVLPNAYRIDPDERIGLFRIGIVAVFVFGAAAAWGIRDLGSRARTSILVGVLALVVVTFGALDGYRRTHLEQIYERDWGKRYAKYAPEWSQIDALEEPARIAYAGLNLPYPLCGLDQQHAVFSVPLDGSPPGLLPHELRAELGNRYQPSDRSVELAVGRLFPDAVKWAAQIRQSEVDYVALYADTIWQPIELRWTEADPQMFERISRRDAKLILYRVLE